jgi:hypothetical protein
MSRYRVETTIVRLALARFVPDTARRLARAAEAGR